MAERPHVKICGLTRAADAMAAERAGADYLGVVLSRGFGRSVETASAAAVFRGTSARRVAVLVDEHPARAADLGRAVDADVLQLHGREDGAAVDALRDLGPWKIWKAVHARSMNDLAAALHEVGDRIDGLLVEGWRAGVVGGGGARLLLEPEAVREVIPESLVFILAGGLTPASVAADVARFAPDVVDVSSGVERCTGVKDAGLVAAFVRAARGTAPPGS